MKANRPRGLPGPGPSPLEGWLAERRVEELVCRSFCRYYRGSLEGERCAGYTCLGRLVAGGRLGPEELLPLAGVSPAPPRRHPLLTSALCRTCPFLREGCDYMAHPPVSGSFPCGGYRLLLTMLRCGALTEERLEALLSS